MSASESTERLLRVPTLSLFEKEAVLALLALSERESGARITVKYRASGRIRSVKVNPKSKSEVTYEAMYNKCTITIHSNNLEELNRGEELIRNLIISVKEWRDEKRHGNN